MRATPKIAAVAVVALALVGCANQGGEMSQSPSHSEGRPPFISAPPLNPSGSAVEVSAAKLEAITADLAKRGVSGEVSVVSATAVTWNDGSLGCPQAGQVYTQALVPGTKVVVSVAGKKFDYHFGGTDAPKLCEAKK